MEVILSSTGCVEEKHMNDIVYNILVQASPGNSHDACTQPFYQVSVLPRMASAMGNTHSSDPS